MSSPASNSNETNYLGNVLFANVGTVLNIGDYINQPYGSLIFNVQNVTFSGTGCLGTLTYDGNNQTNCLVNLTNCILANVTNLCVTNYYYGTSMGVPKFNGANNGFYNSPAFGAASITSSSYPFQSVGAGNYYLASGCSFFNAGTANINPALLAELQQKTTYPPTLLANTTNSFDTPLYPQAARDTDTPDLGYHYDPIDYLVDNFAITNATLTVSGGTAIASYNEAGIQLQAGSAISSIGTPVTPNWFVRYSSVQEQPLALGGTNVSAGQTVSASGGASALFQFSKFTCPAGGGSQLLDATTLTYSNLVVQDCEFWGGQNTFTGSTNTSATLVNNLFYRSAITATATNLYSTLAFSNNLVFGSTVTLHQPTNTVWYAYNNDFDSVTITNSTLTNGYNAYLHDSGYLSPTNATEIFSTNNLAYQTGLLGAFYQPTNSPLINKGSSTADQLGLYHFTTQTNQVKETNSMVDIGYHYVATDAYGNPLETYWIGIPDYLADTNGNGALGVWLIKYFGQLGVDTNADYDGDGTNNLQEYSNGTDPNKISFSFSVTNQYVTTNIVSGVVAVLGGAPSYFAVLVDSTNFSTATWTSYTSSNITFNISTNQGSHDVWIGLRGLPSDAQQTWQETMLILDSAAPTITITNPVNNVSFNSSRVNVSGNFTAGSLKQITVNDVLAFVHGTNFEAVNVPLNPGTNIIKAIVEDLTGYTNISSISIIATTNSDGSLNNPVQFQAAPVAGFAPLPVAFSILTNVPGIIQQVSYDFNGDDIADLITNNLLSITNTYVTNGEYFPFVTLQTSAGRFSSIGGWNAVTLDASNQPIRINVQSQPTQSALASIANPVDLKWIGTNLYVLSGYPAAITEFNTNGSTVRSVSIGTNSSGLDVDAAGNIYVTVTASNQVWKFNPTDTSFEVDGSFGSGGYIGIDDGSTGTGPGEFNAPFDVAVSPDGGTLSVSDSGNNRIQQFDSSGNFLDAFGTAGNAVGQFNSPKGLTYDSASTLYIVDSGNDRIALAQDSVVMGVAGTNGTALGQFNGPVNISVGEKGVYVADTGNNRIQKFNLLPSEQLFNITPANIGYAISTNLNAPASVAAVDSLTNETFYVADTGNNRIVLYSLAADDPTPVWANMTAHVASGDFSGAMPYFSSLSAAKYQQAFLSAGIATTISAINQIGTLTPVYIQSDKAEYYFQQVISGQTITFPVEFVKENGVWKILEF